MNSATIVQKLWNYCNLLRDDDVCTVAGVGRQFVVVNVPRASRLQRPVFVGPNPMTGT